MNSEDRSPDEQVNTPLETVLSQEEQAALTPDQVIEDLKEGNARFTSGQMTVRNHVEQVRQAAAGQFPEAIVLSCVDSRIPVEHVFDCGVGDVFVARVAGNFVNADILGSMEFACKVAGAMVVLVMGHEMCGAVTGAINQVELGNLTSMLAKIEPAVASVVESGAARDGSNADFVRQVAERNVQLNVARIRDESAVLRELEQSGQIKIVGAMYRINSGEVTFLDPVE